jgi:hypothetical protein
MPRGGAGAGLAYAARPDGHQVLVLRAAPRLDSVALDVEQLLPAQLPRRHGPAATGARALLVRLLLLALLDAGWSLDGRTCGLRVVPRSRQRWQGSQALAQRWLLGELDDQVAVPIAWCCDQLGLDAAALAAAVRRSAGTTEPRQEMMTHGTSSGRAAP